MESSTILKPTLKKGDWVRFRTDFQSVRPDANRIVIGQIDYFDNKENEWVVFVHQPRDITWKNNFAGYYGKREEVLTKITEGEAMLFSLENQ